MSEDLQKPGRGPGEVDEATADPPVASAVSAAETKPIRARVLAGAGWTLVGYAVQQPLRLASSLVLTRLLMPEAFGLMTLTTLFIVGLELLSDVGLGPAIIQSKRGDDPKLLDTAWSVQIIRGGILGMVAVVIAKPAALIYGQPELFWLIVVAGVGSMIRGFTPTRIHTLNRQLLLGRVTLMEVTCQILTVGVTILASYLLRSAWGLLLGTLTGDVIRVALSSVMLPGHRHRFRLDPECLKEVLNIGRWVLVSTAFYYMTQNLDRLLMGGLLSVHELGVYSIALNMVNAVTGLGQNLGARVLFPVLAETARVAPASLYARLRKGRAFWLLPTAFALLVLSIAGDFVVRLLYRAEYSEAGWMVSVLAAGSIVTVVNQTCGTAFVALGEFRMAAIFRIVQMPLLLGAMLIGQKLFGIVGFIVGLVAVEFLLYPMQSVLIHKRHKLWQPELDLPVIVVGALAVTISVLLN